MMRRPAWWSVVLTVAGMLVFVRLGIWQWHRADYKDELLRRYAAAASAPVQDFGAVTGSASESVYPRVRVQGRYLVDRLYLLDNPRHDNLGGVEVFAPFQPAHQDKLLLVDLGFLPGNGTDKAPQLPPLPADSQTLQGLYEPPPGTGLEMGGNALPQQKQWPKTSIYLDMNQVAADLHTTLFPRVLALDADPAAIYVRVHTLDLSSMPPARHRAYAFQWFTFALAALVMFVVLHRKRRTPRDARDDRTPRKPQQPQGRDFRFRGHDDKESGGDGRESGDGREETESGVESSNDSKQK